LARERTQRRRTRRLLTTAPEAIWTTSRGPSLGGRRGRPFASQLYPGDFYSSQVHARDLPAVGDVVERVGVQHDERGFLARRHGAELVHEEDASVDGRSGHDRFLRGHAA